MKQLLVVAVLTFVLSNPLLAQQTQHNTDTSAASQHSEDGPPMNSQFSLDLPMNRDGSGTSWVPDETPMYAYMIHSKGWMTMIHGSFFFRYNNQDIFKAGSRGGSKIDAPNWLMAMTQHKVGKN